MSLECKSQERITLWIFSPRSSYTGTFCLLVREEQKVDQTQVTRERYVRFLGSSPGARAQCPRPSGACWPQSMVTQGSQALCPPGGNGEEQMASPRPRSGWSSPSSTPECTCVGMLFPKPNLIPTLISECRPDYTDWPRTLGIGRGVYCSLNPF